MSSRRHHLGAVTAATARARVTARSNVVMLSSHASAFARGDATIVPQSSVASRARVNRACEAKESRIGKQPVVVPKGVTYTLKDNFLTVKVRGRRSRTGGGHGDALIYAASRARVGERRGRSRVDAGRR